MLKTAYNTPKSAKYKYILMALISMMQSSMCLSRWQVADYYFLEAEKLVRLRGLKQIKSRKARLLHHCYVFWCMLQESTYIGGLPGIHRRCVLQAIQSSELVVYSRDSLSFRLPKWTDLEKEIKDVKAQDVGEMISTMNTPAPGHPRYIRRSSPSRRRGYSFCRWSSASGRRRTLRSTISMPQMPFPWPGS
jgi:hypothetical protein